MKAALLFFVFTFSLWGAVLAAPPDNRYKEIKDGEALPDDVPDKFLSGEELLKRILTLHDAKLDQAFLSGRKLALSWQRRVALVDADYFLCIFDAAVRLEPGENARVLLLFTPDYQLKAWAQFDCEERFVAAVTQNKWNDPQTHLVTINQSGRGSDELFFERYIISRDGIQQLGTSFGKVPGR